MIENHASLDEAFVFSQLKLNNIKEQKAMKMIQDHHNLYKEEGMYLSFSGGKDSTALALLTKDLGINVPLCYFDSDVEYPETREYVHMIADKYDFDLHIIHSPSIQTILDNAAFFSHFKDAKGIQSPYDYRNHKITFPAITASKTLGSGVLWGLRADESQARERLLRKNQGVTFNKTLGTHMCAPLWDWSAMNVSSYFLRREIPVNPIYQKLNSLGVPINDQRVGAIIDGSGLDFGRITWLKKGWPSLYEELRRKFPRIEEYR